MMKRVTSSRFLPTEIRRSVERRNGIFNSSLFIGETEEGEDYAGLFPLIGRLLKRYGKDEIHFYLWPLYSDSLSEGARTRNFLWPFFSFTSGEKKKGYRIWPIYGRKEEVGVSTQAFLLWPIL
jgi:hypothetical protein